jgi:hypothetical protein
MRPGPGPLRDQRESAFASILSKLVSRVPGARAAALVDWEGETVDYAGGVDPFAVRVAAAHWRIVIDAAASQKALGCLQRLVVRAARRSFLVEPLPDGYALIVLLSRAAGFASPTTRALAACVRALGEEAGWTWPRGGAPPGWFPLDIVADDRRRPVAVRVAGQVHALEILGALVSGHEGRRARRERGWRVRFDTGMEAMVVRESGLPRRFSGHWYSDEPIEAVLRLLRGESPSMAAEAKTR